MLSSMINGSLRQSLEQQRTELNVLLQRLIRIRSYSGEEKEIVEFIVRKMDELGFDDARTDGLGNVIGRVGNGPVSILFDAHIDTVRVTEGEDWPYPPFEGKIVGNTIYGRGAVDEKPAMAGYLMAVKLLRQQFPNDEFPFTLYVVGSVMEEDIDGYPLYYIIEKEGIRPDFVLLGEPTDLQVYRGQRGRMEIQIRTAGRSAHGAHNEQGVNAIYKMQAVITAIEQLDHRLEGAVPLGKGSITVSQVFSRGPSLCSVPDFCQIHIDRRMALHETKDTVLAELQQILSQTGIDGEVIIPQYEGKSWKGTHYQQEAWFPTWLLEDTHPLVQAGLQVAEQALGRPAQQGVWKFSTNGVASAGRFRIPTIGFAPGREALSHSSQEAVNLDDLFTATLFYAYLPFAIAETNG